MSQSMQFSDRMSETDALIWNIESDPQLRSTIVGVWTLDSEPDWSRFERKLERCTREIPRLRQRAVVDALGIAPPRWEYDPHFDLAFHFRRVRAPGDGSMRALLALAEPIGMQAFDRDRPLWELTRVDGLEGGRAGLIMKLHHAVSDGMGLVRMTAGMIERSAEPDEKEALPLPALPSASSGDELERTLSAATHRARTGARRAATLVGAFAGGVRRLLENPANAVRDAADGAGSIGRLLQPVTEPMSPLMRGRSLSVYYDTIDVSLDELRRAGKAVGGTVNDAFVAAVAGGLRRYHEDQGTSVEELRMNMPINTRSGERSKDAGNQFAPVRFAVPVGMSNPAERMVRIHELVAEQRAEPALPLLEGISAVIGSLPGRGAALFSSAMMKAVDFTTSNVPGPRFPVYLSGARIERMFGFGPMAGAAANITCFSYNGQLGIGVNVDTAAIKDPALFVECLQKGIDEVLAVV